MKTVAIDDAVRAVLLRATMTGSGVVLPPGHLDRKLYERIDKVLCAAGGKWDRKSKSHLFPSGIDPRELLGQPVLAGEAVVHRQKTLQQFVTPPELAKRLVEYAEVKPGHRCLEPSAGFGAIADAIQAGRSVPWLGQDPEIHVIDIDEVACTALLQRFGYVFCLDFLEVEPPPYYDRIVMNPPFAKGQDIAHVTHAFAMLAPGGVLVSVVAPSFETRSSKAHASFRDLVERHGSVVERLPPGTFADTNVASLVVRLIRA